MDWQRLEEGEEKGVCLPQAQKILQDEGEGEWREEGQQAPYKQMEWERHLMDENERRQTQQPQDQKTKCQTKGKCDGEE